MIKRFAGILAATALLVFGCSDGQSPTEPRVQVSPTAPPAALPPVITSAERSSSPRLGGWVLHGSHFLPNPKVTIDDGRFVNGMRVSEASDNRIAFSSSFSVAANIYTPCVETVYGKGCALFKLK